MTKQKESKKVLFTSHTANFSKFNRPFMRWFSRQGWEVHYASAGEEEVLDCDKHHTISFARSPFSLDNIRAIGQVRKLLSNNHYDIIHTHTPMGSIVTRIAARKARKSGTRVIYTAHGLHFFKGAPLINWLLYFPMEWLMSFVTDDLILINSEDYERAKRSFHAKKEHYLKGGVGVDASRFRLPSRQEKSRLRKKHELKIDDFILLCVAEFTKNKQQSLLLRAMPELRLRYPNMRLLLAGRGREFDACRGLARALGVQDCVDFLGYRDNIEEYYKMADCLVSASQREGLGLNLVEALMSGLPVVCSANRGHCEVSSLVDDATSVFLFEQGDVAQYSDRIGQVVEQLNKQQPGAVDRSRYDVFSTQHSVRQMVGVYRGKY